MNLKARRVEERGTFDFSLIRDYFGCLIFFKVFFLMSALKTG